MIPSRMEHREPDTFDMQKMIADYMENGMLDNIVDMFKHDKGLYDYIPALLTDERIRVRIGTIALLEALAVEDGGNTREAIRVLLPLLGESSPLVQGDAAYVLGLIGNAETIPYLEELLSSENSDVRMIAEEAIQDIRSRH